MKDSDVDKIFQEFNDLFNAGDFDKADSVLLSFDLPSLDTSGLIVLLSATLAAKSKLVSRKQVVRRVEGLLTQHVSPERVQRLLRGLR